jgi:hypothetical protein
VLIPGHEHDINGEMGMITFRQDELDHERRANGWLVSILRGNPHHPVVYNLPP